LLQGRTVNGALFVTPCAVALIDMVAGAETFEVRIANDLLVVPAEKVMDGVSGPAIDGFVLETAAVIPPDGAAHSIVAAALTVPPPVIVDGVNTTRVR
jgi:hypothetical protein